MQLVVVERDYRHPHSIGHNSSTKSLNRKEWFGVLMLDTRASRIQSGILHVLAKHQSPARSFDAYRTLATQVAEVMDSEVIPGETEIMEAVWGLLGLRLVYVNYYGDRTSRPAEWQIYLTAAGQAVVDDEVINPDTADGYLRRLNGDVPDASTVVMLYTTESVLAFERSCYLASAVMLGVATEAAFLEMADSFSSWLSERQDSTLATILTNPRASYDSKFTEFRKRLAPHRTALPFERHDGIDLRLNSIIELIRIFRNDAGHPTGKVVSRARARDHLILFAGLLEEIYALNL